VNLAWNILTTLWARIAALMLALVSSIVLARMLGPEGRGLFALVLLMPELAMRFGLLGFDQANAVYGGLEPGRRRALVWQSAAIAAVAGGSITAAGMCLVAFGSQWSQTLVHGPLWLYLLPMALVPGQMAAEYWGAILRGMNRIFLVNLFDFGARVAGVALILVLVAWLRLGVAGAVWAESLVSVGTVVGIAVLLRYGGVWGRPVFDRSLWRRTWRFALPAHCSNVLSYLNYRADQFIVAALLPPEQLGFYAMAVALAERLWIVTGAVANPLLPHLTNSRGRDPALAAIICRHVVLWTGAACLLLFVLGDVVVRTLYSSAFVPVVAPLRWLLPGILTLTVGKILSAEMQAREKINYTIWAAGLATVVNIVGNLALVPRLGISGAAIASSISYTVLSFVVLQYYLRETGVPAMALVPRLSDFLTYAAFWHGLFQRASARTATLRGTRP
jgi:O-antigen/teichoic acid export membrane protein